MSDLQNHTMSIVSKIMYSYGDCETPRIDSVNLVYEILVREMCGMLNKAKEMASRLKSSKVSHEHILFVIRKDKGKLRRLMKYLHHKDMRNRALDSISTGINSANYCAEELKEKLGPTRTSAFQYCMQFLTLIDETGGFIKSLQIDKVDRIEEERMIRQNKRSLELSAEDYDAFSAARIVGFGGRNRLKFEQWLTLITKRKMSFSPLILELLAYLAQETIAQVVELALKSKSMRTVDPVEKAQSTIDYSVPQPSTSSDVEHKSLYLNSLNCIQPRDIIDAMNFFFETTPSLSQKMFQIPIEEKFLFTCTTQL